MSGEPIKSITPDEWRRAACVGPVGTTGVAADGELWEFLAEDLVCDGHWLPQYSSGIDDAGGLVSGPAYDFIRDLRAAPVASPESQRIIRAENQRLTAELASMTGKRDRALAQRDGWNTIAIELGERLKAAADEARANSGVAEIGSPRKPRSVWLGGDR